MTNPDLVRLAEKLAIQAHAGQFRRNGITPYIEHPKAVLFKLVTTQLFDRVDSATIAVAWLHDVIEDGRLLGHRASHDDIARWLALAGIPARVVQAVQVLTHPRGESYVDYLERCRDHAIAKKVKIADMLANLADDPTPSQIVKYSRGLLFMLGHAGREIFGPTE